MTAPEDALGEVVALMEKADAAKAHADAPLEQAQWSRTCFANAARMDAERAALAWVRTHGSALLQRLEAAEAALECIAGKGWNRKEDFCHPEGCDSPGIAKAALASAGTNQQEKK